MKGVARGRVGIIDLCGSGGGINLLYFFFASFLGSYFNRNPRMVLEVCILKYAPVSLHIYIMQNVIPITF